MHCAGAALNFYSCRELIDKINQKSFDECTNYAGPKKADYFRCFVSTLQISIAFSKGFVQRFVYFFALIDVWTHTSFNSYN